MNNQIQLVHKIPKMSLFCSLVSLELNKGIIKYHKDLLVRRDRLKILIQTFMKHIKRIWFIKIKLTHVDKERKIMTYLFNNLFMHNKIHCNCLFVLVILVLEEKQVRPLLLSLPL